MRKRKILKDTDYYDKNFSFQQGFFFICLYICLYIKHIFVVIYIYIYIYIFDS